MKKKKISFWYIIIILLVAIVLFWFFVDLNKTTDSKIILKNAETAASPIKNAFNQDAIDNIKKRKDISDSVLVETKTYQDESTVKKQ